jgi:equilibrative nucleoside transporter 1/2/3
MCDTAKLDMKHCDDIVTHTMASDLKERALVNVLFALIGVGYLFPFSALTQPVDYWSFLFPDFNIEFPITCVFMYTNLIMLGLLVSFGGQNPWMTGRIVGGFIGQLLVLLFVPTAYFFLSSESARMVSILGATAVAAIVTAFLDSCVIALAASYPIHAQEALQFGIGLSTLIGSAYRDFTKVVFPVDAVITSSSLYFYGGALTVGLCICAYFILMRLPMSKRCLLARSEEKNPLIHSSVNNDAAFSDGDTLNRWDVLRKCLFNEIQVSLLFTCTLCLWPPLVTEIKSFNCPSLQASGWWSLILLTLHSVMDCLGRICVPYYRYFGLTKDNIWKIVAFRFIMIPCIVMSARGIVFAHDAYSIVFVLFLGFTNGYIGSLTILFVNDCVAPHEKALAGSFTGFFLNFGLVIGSTVGLLLSRLI